MRHECEAAPDIHDAAQTKMEPMGPESEQDDAAAAFLSAVRDQVSWPRPTRTTSISISSGKSQRKRERWRRRVGRLQLVVQEST